MGRRRIQHFTPMSLRRTKRRMTVLGIFHVDRDQVKIKTTKNDKLLMDLYRPKVITQAKAVPHVPSPSISSPVRKPIHGMSDLEVYNKFYSQFPKYASVFVEHEIDGEALLLLARKDVMRLKLPVGPKVRMWEAIRQFIGTRS